MLDETKLVRINQKNLVYYELNFQNLTKLYKMSFFSQLNNVVVQCKRYLKHVEDKNLLDDPAIQKRYKAMQQLLNIYQANKPDIKYAHVNHIKAPDTDGFGPAREHYYELVELVPKFLAQEFRPFYYLQEYKIATSNLIIILSKSKFKGDWPKLNALINWYNAILKDQEAQDAKASIKQSFEDIRELGDFEFLSPEEMYQLQEEVHNIQAFLHADESLEAELTAEDSQLLREAIEFLSDKDIVLEGIPESTNDMSYPTVAPFEFIANYAFQIQSLVEDFAEDYPRGTKAVALTGFKEALKNRFNHQHTICTDIYEAIIKQIGSHKKPSIARLCKMIERAFNNFTDELKLSKKYDTESMVDSNTLEKGIATILEFEQYLKASMQAEG